MTVAATLLLGIIAAGALAAVAARRPRTASSAPEPPERRELRSLREDLASGEIGTEEYERTCEGIAERLAGSALLAAPQAAATNRSRRWVAAGLVAGAIVVAALPGAVRQRGANDYPTGNDSVAAESTVRSGMEEWQAAERRRAAGDEAAAVAHYRRAVALMPERVELRARFGLALAEAGGFEEALAQLRLAVRSAPRDPDGRLYLGAVLFGEGRLRDAARQWRRFLELKPRGASARLVRRTLARSDRAARASTGPDLP